MLIQAKILKNALSKLIGIIPAKSTIPILENVLFDFKEYFLHISASDLDICGVACVPYEVKMPNFCLNAKRLYDTVKMIEDDEIEFKMKDGYKLTIKTLRGEYKLTAENPQDYPHLPKEENLIELPKILDKIKKVVYACASDELKPAMTGVLVGDDVVATDGHVLSLCSFPEVQKELNLSLPKGTNILIPQKVLNIVLKSISENTDICANEKTIKFYFKNEDFEYSIISKLIDEQYPNYKAVLPTDYTNRVWIKRSDLLNSIRRLIIFSSSVSHQIKITFCDKIEIRAIDSDVGAEAIESLEIKSENDGIPTEIGLNAEYAIKTLQSMTDEEIMIEYDTPIKALVLEGENHKCIIMPVRIN